MDKDFIEENAEVEAVNEETAETQAVAEVENTEPDIQPAEETETVEETEIKIAPESTVDECSCCEECCDCEIAEADKEVSETTEEAVVQAASEAATDECSCCEEFCTCEENEAVEEETVEKSKGDVEYCLHCGVNRVYGNDEYCSVCTKALKKTRIPFTAFASALVALVASFVAFVLVIFVASPSVQIMQGDIDAARGCWYSAYSDYDQVDDLITEVTEALGSSTALNQFVQTGCGFKIKQFEAIAKAYSPLEAVQYSSYIFDTADSSYTEKNETYQYYNSIYSLYESTYNGLADAISILQSEEDPDGAEIIAKMEEARGSEGVDDVFLDYYLFSVAGYCNMGNDEMLKYLEMLDEDAKASEYDYEWLYYEDYANILIDADRDDEAIPFLEARAEADSSNYDARMMLMKVYVKQGDIDSAKAIANEYCAENESDNGDSDTGYIMRVYLLRCEGKLDEAKALAEEGMETYSTAVELMRQAALIDLAQGDYNSAYDKCFEAENTAYYMYYYYGDSSQMSDELSLTLYVAASLAKQGGTYDGDNADSLDEVIDSFADSEFTGTAQQVVDGKLTAEEVLTKGVYDFT